VFIPLRVFNALCIWGGREDSIREYLLSEGQ